MQYRFNLKKNILKLTKTTFPKVVFFSMNDTCIIYNYLHTSFFILSSSRHIYLYELNIMNPY